jgi:hypothetical protein
MPTHRLTRWLASALLCGALPLITGVAIFLVWLPTRWKWLEPAGAVTMMLGWAFLLAGLFCLYKHIDNGLRSAPASRARILVPSLAALAIMLLNIPVGYTILNIVISIETRYTVTIINHTRESLDEIVVEGGGVREHIGTLPPGGQTRRSFHFRQDGTLMFHAREGNKQLEQTVEGYVCGGWGGETTIILSGDGIIEIRKIANDQ